MQSVSRWKAGTVGLLIGSIFCVVPALAETPAPKMDHSQHADHTQHRMAMTRAAYTRSMEQYTIPEATLLNQEGDAIELSELFNGDRPVAVTFIFTTCTTICPVMTATFLRMQNELSDDVEKPRIVTISIDPEFDTPAVLKDYASRYDFGPGWEFLTGQPDDVEAVLKSFNAYYGDKMNHRPLYFFKRSGDDSWLRIEGLAKGSDMVKEYRELTAN
jgi:protein SCO1/2